MPTTPWMKLKFSRFISNLRSKGGDPLVVQTGFPTSLADLFVKNRSRLRKSSRKKQHSPPTDLGSSSVSRAPKIVAESAAAVRFQSNGPNPGGVEIVGEIQSPPDTVDKALTPPPEFSKKAGTETSEDSEGRSRVFFRIVATLFLVMILAVGTKEFALGITVSAFTLLFLESVGKCVINFLKPCLRSFKSVMKGVPALNLIETINSETDSKRTENLPIETNVVFRLDLDSLSSSDWSSELAVSNRQSKKKGSEERERQGEVSDCFEKHKAGGGAKVKLNKLLRKFVPEKFRGGKGGKQRKRRSENGGASSRGVCAKKEEEGPGTTVEEGRSTDDNGGEKGVGKRSFKTQNEVLDINACLARENASGKWKPRHLAFIAIVLSGLVGGRLAALVLTVAWYLLLKSSRSTWRRWKGRQS